jgi:CBS domain-containing protein
MRNVEIPHGYAVVNRLAGACIPTRVANELLSELLRSTATGIDLVEAAPRDIPQFATVLASRSPNSRFGRALMTAEVKTCSPEDAIVELMEVMTLQRIRQLPVISNGALEGIVSIGDVVKQRLKEAQSELDELRNYISSSS